MAGMLPGVESARRRRFHQTGVGFSDSIGTVGSTRRSSFCLYSSNFASHNSFALRTNQNQIYQVEELRGVARVAKERLDERLKAQWKSSDAKRIDARNNNGTEEVIGTKNKRLKWGKLMLLGWKSPSSSSPSSAGQEEQEECVICLEGFKIGGERVMQIACGHRFHSGCLVPWLDANAHCPCCRMGVTT